VWSNRLFGDLPGMENGPFDRMDGQSPLMRDGSGRLWAQGERVRFDAQGAAGDQLVVADGAAGTLWVYDSTANLARLYEVEGAGERGRRGFARRRDAVACGSDPRAHRGDAAARPHRFMSVEVTGRSVVAGQDAYLLTMTPAADDTALGTIQAASTVAPSCRCASTSSRAAGASRCSPSASSGCRTQAIDDDVFAFTPPEGAQVERETIDPDEIRHGDKAKGAEATASRRRSVASRHGARCSPSQRRSELVAFDLRAAEGYEARAFRWAYVFDGGLPLDAGGAPLFAADDGRPGRRRRGLDRGRRPDRRAALRRGLRGDRPRADRDDARAARAAARAAAAVRAAVRRARGAGGAHAARRRCGVAG
jgi:hypothetical protein